MKSNFLRKMLYYYPKLLFPQALFSNKRRSWARFTPKHRISFVFLLRKNFQLLLYSVENSHYCIGTQKSINSSPKHTFNAIRCFCLTQQFPFHTKQKYVCLLSFEKISSQQAQYLSYWITLVKCTINILILWIVWSDK